MKKAIFLIYLLIFSQLCFANWSQNYKKKKSSIPMIFSSGGICSGIFIDQNTILTAAHCVWHFRPIKYYFHYDEHRGHSAKIIKIDKKHDLALLQTSLNYKDVKNNVLPIDTEITVGEEISTIGHPSSGKAFSHLNIDTDSTYLLSTGVISKVTKNDLITDMSLSPGNSGGPVFNKKGDLVGIVSRKRIDRYVGNIGYLTNHYRINKFLKKESRLLSKFNASTSTSMNFSFTNHSYLRSFTNIDPTLLHLNFSFNFWDRLYMGYNFNVQEVEKVRFSDFTLGYKFIHVFNNQSLFTYTPFIGFIDYRTGNQSINGFNNSSAKSWGINIKFSSFPIGFRYERFTIKNQQEDILFFNLNLF